MPQAAYQVNDFDAFFGIDVDKRRFSLTMINRDGTNERSKSFPADEENFYRYIQNNHSGKRILCGYEAGPTGFHLHDYLTQRKVECIVMPPSSVPKPSDSRVKTNRIDSVRISHCLRNGEARPIRVPDDSYRELRHLITARERYSLQSKRAKQRIKALLLYAHLDTAAPDAETRWSGSHIDRLKSLDAPRAVRIDLDLLIEDLTYARSKMAQVIKNLRTFSLSHPEIDRYRKFLESIPGIGFQVAMTTLGRIGDPKRLVNVREISAFFGLVPCENSTGDKVNRGPITHLGNSVARSLIVEAAWVAIRYDTELNQFYHRIRGRHHPSCGARKAIVAVARKLTHRIYSVLTEERPYVVR